MLSKKKIICALLLCYSSFFLCQSQNTHVQIKEKNGTTTTFELNTIHRLTFNDQTLHVITKDANESNYAFSNLQYVSFGIPTGIEPIGVLQQDIIKPYPNPVSEQLNCDIKSDKSEDLTLQIFSMDGRVLLQKKQLIVNGLNHIEIPVSSLDDGIYFIQIQKSETTKTFKFIKK